MDGHDDLEQAHAAHPQEQTGRTPLTAQEPPAEQTPPSEQAFEPDTGGVILGVGVDVVDIARLSDRFESSPGLIERLLAPSERDLPPASRAARVAAKEAVGKALGTPGDFSWQDVTVRRTADGRPYPVLTGAALAAARRLGVGRLHLSLSHDAGQATATAIAERGGPPPWSRAVARPEPSSSERKEEA